MNTLRYGSCFANRREWWKVSPINRNTDGSGFRPFWVSLSLSSMNANCRAHGAEHQWTPFFCQLSTYSSNVISNELRWKQQLAKCIICIYTYVKYQSYVQQLAPSHMFPVFVACLHPTLSSSYWSCCCCCWCFFDLSCVGLLSLISFFSILSPVFFSLFLF